jgi:putative nucleotidyltransferase with HDIG domain
MKRNIAAIIPAAGLSSRMKAFKPLLPMGKQSILETSIDLFKQNGVNDICVVTGHRSGDLELLITKKEASWVHNPDYHQGMFSTILAGVKRLKNDCDAFFLLPADIPAIRPHTIKEILRAYRNGKGKIIYPVFKGVRGHPPLISTQFLNPIINFNQGGGLRACLGAFEKESMDLEVCDRGIHMDADTQEDYNAVLKKYMTIAVPEFAECLCLLENSPMADEKIMKHCIKVAEIAVKIATRLDQDPPGLDIPRIEVAALLHDIARKSPDHAVKGGKILKEMGFSDIADIVSAHMDLKTTPGTPLNEKEIIYFADKLVVGDQVFMDFEKRFKDKLISFQGHPAAVENIRARLETACIIKEKISKHLKMEFGSNFKM